MPNLCMSRFVKEKKGGQNFLIAFLMMLVLFVNGPNKIQVKHVQRDTNWLVFDVNIWCYVGSLILSAHIGHIPKLQNARQQSQPIQ